MSQVTIPAGQVAQGGAGVPQVCSRHGEPGLVSRRLQIISKPPPWTYLLILLGALPFLLAVMLTRKSVTAPAWPFCPRCQSDRSRGISIGLGLLAFGISAMCGGVTLSSDYALAPVLLLVGLVLVLVAIVVMARSGWVFQSRANVSPDGLQVLVRDPAPAFATQLTITRRPPTLPDPPW